MSFCLSGLQFLLSVSLQSCLQAQTSVLHPLLVPQLIFLRDCRLVLQIKFNLLEKNILPVKAWEKLPDFPIVYFY